MRVHAALPLLAALAAAAPAAPETLRFAPADGLVLQRTQESLVSLELDSMEVRQGGESTEQELEVSQSFGESLVVVDRIEHGEDGVAVVRRTFSEAGIERELDTPEESTTENEETDLLEETVVWSFDGDEWTVAFPDDSDADEALLEDLEFEMDAQAFLPDGDVEVGDTWEVDASALEQLLSPGGDLQYLGEGESLGDEDPEGELSEQAMDDLDGDVTVEFVEVREDEALGRLAVLLVTLEAEGGAEAENEADLEGAPDGMSANESVELTLAFDGEATLVWALDRGYLVSVEADGDISLERDSTLQLSGPQGEMELGQRFVFEGTFTIRYAVEEVE